MGTSRSAAELSTKMNRIATTIPRATRTGVSESALRGKNTIIAVAAQRGVSTGSRIAGGKWSVRYDIKGTTRPTALLRIRGQFHLVESPTRGHPIPGNRRRRNRKKALAFNGVVRAKVQHPGTRGKFIFRDAKKRIVAATPPAVMKHIVTDMTSALR
jgi:hypothetical protein